MVYAIRVDHLERLEIALIAAGGDVSPGALVEDYDQWLGSEPEVIDREKAQLLAALGVGP